MSTEHKRFNGPATVAEFITQNPQLDIISVNNDDAYNWYVIYREKETQPDPELLLRGMEEGAEEWKMRSENWQFRFEKVFAALKELVELKVAKDANGDTENYLKRKPEAWRVAKDLVTNINAIGVTSGDKHYGFYQLCPKCDGEGEVPAIGTSATGIRICPVCNGAKLLVRPEIKEDKTQQP